MNFTEKHTDIKVGLQETESVLFHQVAPEYLLSEDQCVRPTDLHNWNGNNYLMQLCLCKTEGD